MRYTPYSEAEIQSMGIMPAGIYPFSVLEIIDIDKDNRPMVDKNGNDLAKIKLVIWDHDNKERTLYTYVSGDGAFAYKLRHFAKSIGMIQDYEQGIFNLHHTVGKSGKADIVIKKGTTKTDGSGELWPDRNDVKDFVVETTQGTPRPDPFGKPASQSNPNHLQGVDDLNDTIPF